MTKKFKIAVRVLQGQILIFVVDTYQIVDGGFVQFIDPKFKVVKKYHASNCEITEVEE